MNYLIIPITKTKSFVLSALFVCISFDSFSQISLPRQFKCQVSKESFRENFFTDGTYSFKTDAWGNGAAETPADLKPYLSDYYENQIPFKKTKDNLYWGTGIYRGKYYYIVVIPNSLATVTLSSTTNGTQFSNYSSWLLQQVRNNISSSKDFYLTNFMGKECGE
jgi:hypothetical protein